MECIDEELDKIDNIISDTWELEADKANILLMKTIKKLDALNKKHPKNDRIAFYTGYCWYNLNDSSKDRYVNCKNSFTKALQLNSLNYFALLYLGHLFYDEGKYHEAKKILQKIPKNIFKEKGQLWRDLKIKELILCTEIHIKPCSLTPKSIEVFNIEFLRTDEVNRPMPTELVKTIRINSQKMKPVIKDILPHLRRLLMISDSIHIYKEDLKIIENHL